MKRMLGCLAALGLGIAAGVGPAGAADTIAVGTAAQTFAFVPLDVGLDRGLFSEFGLDVKPSAIPGAAKLNQAMIAGAVDIGITGSTDFAFQVKGAPSRTVAGIIDNPVYLGFQVLNRIKSVDDLKGGKIGVSQAGTLTFWLARKLAESRGWGPDGVIPVGIGAVLSTQVAALLTGQVDAVVTDIGIGLTLKQEGRGYTLLTAADLVPGFVLNSIIANDSLIASRPDVLRRFLAGWFHAVAFLRTHKEDTVRIGAAATGMAPEILERVFEVDKPMWSATGQISQAQLQQLSQALQDLKLVEGQPDLARYWTAAFLPN